MTAPGAHDDTRAVEPAAVIVDRLREIGEPSRGVADQIALIEHDRAAIRRDERAKVLEECEALRRERDEALASGQGYVSHFGNLVRQRNDAEERVGKLEIVVQNLASHRHADHCGEDIGARPGYERRSVPIHSWRVCESAHCRMAQEALGLRALSSPEPQA